MSFPGLKAGAIIPSRPWNSATSGLTHRVAKAAAELSDAGLLLDETLSNNPTMTHLGMNAKRLARLASALSAKVVFAESCTGGLVAATLAKVPGISEHLCGSAVTYRSDTKHQWLSVSSDKLTRPGPVSAIVAREMAAGVLLMTPEADWSASVTGHLGPNAPKRLDGLVYIGIARRIDTTSQHVTASRHLLSTETRLDRQREAASLVLQKLFATIESSV